MDDIITRWITAEVTLLPDADGRPQRPPCIFTGYHNSNLRFERSEGEGYGPPVGGAAFFPVGCDALPVGETGPAYLRLYGLADLTNALRPGTRFLLTEAGRLVICGVISELLPDAPDLDAPRSP